MDVSAERADYGPQWRQYGLRRGVALTLVLGWLPFSVAAYLVAQARFEEPLLALPAMLVWGGLAAAAVWWAGETRCPRCRRRFGALSSRQGLGAIWRGLFDPVCSNCKLRKFVNE